LYLRSCGRRHQEALAATLDGLEAGKGRPPADRISGFGSAGGAVAGGLVGAGTGALIGNAVTAPPPGRCAQWAYDYNGNRICIAY
jgi:hypothetical protein